MIKSSSSDSGVSRGAGKKDKRALLWGSKKKENASGSGSTQWQDSAAALGTYERANKFLKLMGSKGEVNAAAARETSTKQAMLNHTLETQFEFGRSHTRTGRGLG